jgi:hypothetical protein
MSLRTFHLVFILLAIVGADLFGAWAVWNFAGTGDYLILILGVISVLGGFGLIWYAFRFVRKMNEQRIS